MRSVVMRVSRTLRALVVTLSVTVPCAAQTRADTVAATNAFVNAVLAEKRTPSGWSEIGAVVIDSGGTAWGALAARHLRAALPQFLIPTSDTARYYALHVTLQSISMTRGDAEVRVVWSLCRRSDKSALMNSWANPTVYSLRRGGDGWVASAGRIEAYYDGYCRAYPGE